MNNPTQPMLELRGISKRFGGTTALDTIDWQVAEGEVHCLVGENGCGKSTLIKIVSGVHRPEAGGEIGFAGEWNKSLTPHAAKALGIQVIFQDLSLFPNLTVYENIGSDYGGAGLLAPVRRKAMRARAIAAMERVGTRLPLDAKVGGLTVSQRQLVAICRGLASNARLLFMDEPTASLTRHEAEILFATVRRLKEQGVSIVFVSHRLEEIIEIADRVTVMRDGRKVATSITSEVDIDRLTELMTGETISHQTLDNDVPQDTPRLQVSGLARRGEFEDVSFSVAPGEVLGIVGLLGAGRTELALTLFGMTQPDRGTIRLDGEELQLSSNRDAISRGIAYVSEDRLSLGLNVRQSISDNIALTVLDRLRDRLGQVPVKRRRALAERWVGRLGVKTQAVSDPVLTLSGGNQQRIVLAKWLATDPRVLILDSPTVGVDVRNKKAIYDLMRTLTNEGLSIILISDEVSEVFFHAHRVLHMAGGRLMAEYQPRASSRQQIADAVYA